MGLQPLMEPTSGVQIESIAAEDTYPLRHEVLWPHEPPLSVRLTTDPAGFHLGAFSGKPSDSITKSPPIGVISIFLSERVDKPAHSEDSSNGVEAQFRKLAVSPGWQGQGIGSKLLEHAMVLASNAGAGAIWCDARTSAIPFYQKAGMCVEGGSFMKKDVEYVKMRRVLSYQYRE